MSALREQGATQGIAMSTSAERMRELRAKRQAAGLRTDGKPKARKKPQLEPSFEHYGPAANMSASLARNLGLESVLWLAEAQPKRSAYLRGLHARAARLPQEWWLSRMHWSIEAIISAVERASPLSQPVLTLKI